MVQPRSQVHGTWRGSTTHTTAAGFPVVHTEGGWTMRKLLVWTMVAACMGAGLAAGGSTQAAPVKVAKVTVCHVPPGNPRQAHTISISQSAVDSHLAHGDYLGECHVCEPGSTVTCYSGPLSTDGIGACHAGTQTCADGTGYGECTGEVTPSPEVCSDGLDNDCDGIADEGCVCAPASTVPCYDGPTGTAGVGACTAGTQACNAEGSGYGGCRGQGTPADAGCGGPGKHAGGGHQQSVRRRPGAPSPLCDGSAGTEGSGQ